MEKPIPYTTKWKYHRTLAPVLVTTEKEEGMLDPLQWADTPGAFGVITCPTTGQGTYDPALDVMADPSSNLDSMTKAQLVAFAKEQGIEINVRLSKADVLETIQKSMGNGSEV